MLILAPARLRWRFWRGWRTLGRTSRPKTQGTTLPTSSRGRSQCSAWTGGCGAQGNMRVVFCVGAARRIVRHGRNRGTSGQHRIFVSGLMLCFVFDTRGRGQLLSTLSASNRTSSRRRRTRATKMCSAATSFTFFVPDLGSALLPLTCFCNDDDSQRRPPVQLFHCPDSCTPPLFAPRPCG